MKKISLILIFLFVGCSLLAQTNIEIKLNHVVMPQGGGRKFGSFLKDKSNFQIDSNKYEVFGVWAFNFDGFQHAYDKFLQGNSKDSTFLKAVDFFKGNSKTLVKPGLDNATYVFAGVKKNGEYVLIPDANSNKNFLDDSVYIYRKDYVPKDSVDQFVKKLPIVIIKVNAWNGNQLQDCLLHIKFIPKVFFGEFKANFGTPAANALLICAESNDYWKGDFTIQNKAYTLWIQNEFPEARLIDKSLIRLLVNSTNKNVIDFSNDYSLYQLTDSIPISKFSFSIKKIDPFGKSIELKYNGYNKGEGITPGFFAKNIVGTDVITSKQISLLNSKGHYVLLDFWGTWCAPCIEAMPELSKINSQYARKGLQIISIAYDNKLTNVVKFVNDSHMIWSNLFQSMSQDRKIITDYRVSDYPTTILIDPKGKIIFRGASKSSIENVNNLLFTLIN